MLLKRKLQPSRSIYITKVVKVLNDYILQTVFTIVYLSRVCRFWVVTGFKTFKDRVK